MSITDPSCVKPDDLEKISDQKCKSKHGPVHYYLIIHRCLKIGTSIVTVRAVKAQDAVECCYALSVTMGVPIFRQ